MQPRDVGDAPGARNLRITRAPTLEASLTDLKGVTERSSDRLSQDMANLTNIAQVHVANIQARRDRELAAPTRIPPAPPPPAPPQRGAAGTGATEETHTIRIVLDKDTLKLSPREIVSVINKANNTDEGLPA
jgi:hypothetical protein